MNAKITWFSIVLIVISALTTLAYHSTQQADINYFQGHRLFLKGNYVQAVPHYKAALEIDPLKISASKELAYSYLWTGRPEKAIKLFRDIVSRDPSNRKPQESLAEAFSWQKNYKEAILLYKKLISEEDDIDVKYKLAEVYMWDKQTKKAKELVEDILEEDPENSKTQMLWGKLLLYTGKPEKASKIFEQLLKEEEK